MLVPRVTKKSRRLEISRQYLLIYLMRKQQINPVDKEVGARLKARRQILGMTQTDLGKAIGVTFQQVQKYEKGADRVSSGRLQQIANALKVPVTLLFDGVPGSWIIPNVDPNISAITEFCAAPDGATLMRSFSRVQSKPIRRAIVLLVEALASDQ
jgi:transcriptional regulator with XRE-family HTH domain